MGLFGRMKDGIKSKANAALDKAIDPAKEIDMMITQLDEQRKKALQELISYKATAKQMETQQQEQEARAVTWEKRAMTAVKAGDDDSAREALKQKKAAQLDAAKIRRDRDEAAGYAVELNKSRKEFETKLAILKLKRGTLATQLAAARAGGDAFGNDTSVWDQFQKAEDRIEEETVASEVDAAMRGEQARDAELEGRILSAGTKAGVSASGGLTGDDALAKLKARMEAARSPFDKAAPALRAGPAAQGARDPRTGGTVGTSTGTGAAEGTGTGSGTGKGGEGDEK